MSAREFFRQFRRRESKAPALRTVGTCGVCGGSLRFDAERGYGECPCGVSEIPSAFMEHAGR